MKWSEMDFDAQCDALCMAIDPVEELATDKELLRLLRDKNRGRRRDGFCGTIAARYGRSSLRRAACRWSRCG